MTTDAPPKKFTRVKRLLGSAGLGVALGIACQLLPPAWRVPCVAAVKIFALLFGVSQ